MDHGTPATLKGRLALFFKGMAMGIADSVPGVSGGTIAVMAGIYEELINSLKNLHPLTVPVLWQQGPAAFWARINGTFLLVLLAGILTSLFVAANTVLYLLDAHYPLIMAFFCGLVLASTWFLIRETGQWGGKSLLFALLGAGLALVISFANPLTGNTSLIYLFCCGMVAICAMILPGISGAFVLLLLGAYDYVLSALRGLQIDVIVVFATGCAIGILSFSHVLSWTFRHYRGQTYAFLTGMLAASVVVLWPWKVTPEQEGATAAYYGPSTFEAATGEPAAVISVILLAVLGFALVLIFERISGRQTETAATTQTAVE